MPLIYHAAMKTNDRAVKLAILVAALGYFVDVFDIQLFNMLRVDSLKAIGVPDDALTSTGVYLLNMQMIGMLVGGVLWGVLGDIKGRVRVLFGSIFLYSVATFANAFVTTVDQYALCRLLAGIGLAGEVGAAITLVSELMPKDKRGYGTTIVATVGILGAVAAAYLSLHLDWKTMYIVGGGMGMLLLLLRLGVPESNMFKDMKHDPSVRRGDVGLLIGNPKLLSRYIMCIFCGVPIWYAAGIMNAFSPEIGASLGIQEPIKVAITSMFLNVGLATGDMASGLVSQYFKSRRGVMAVFILLTACCVLGMMFIPHGNLNLFYAMYLPLGFFIGYWVLFLTNAAEQFGTNLRATVTSTLPNFVRGSTVIMTLTFSSLKPDFGAAGAAALIGGTILGLALLSVWRMRETFGVDLNFVERRPEKKTAKRKR